MLNLANKYQKRLGDKLKSYKEIRKDQKIVKKHGDAYSLGRYTEVDNYYPNTSEKYKAFNFGRLAKLTREMSK